MQLKNIFPLLLSAPVLAQSTLPFGTVISSCTVSGVVALTFDDGPYIYTSELLDLLAANSMKATFFLNGQNYDSIYNYEAVVQRMISDGHQVGSHTWDHADLATLDAAGVTSEMSQLEDALLDILGYFPAYMRPPYFSYTDDTLATLGSLGYHVIQADVDTEDWQNTSPDTIGQSATIYDDALAAGSTLSLSHDTLVNTVETLAQDMIDAIVARGLTSVPVGACLGDDAANWYRTDHSGDTTDPDSGGDTGDAGTSADGSCGGSSAYVCPSGQCCSEYGYCGSTSEYCSTGCQPDFGSCS